METSDNNRWIRYQGALLWNGLPDDLPPTEQQASEALQEQKGMFARWTSGFDCGYATEWWYCICDSFTPISELTAKQRYRVNKGLKQCEIVMAKNDSRTDKYAIYEVVKKSFEDYPAAYRPHLEKDDFFLHLNKLLHDDAIDIWLVYSEQNTLVGYCQCSKTGNAVWLTQVKVPTAYLGLEVNAALVYTLCDYYLNTHHYRYICDGERNIKHQTNYQDFLVRVLNFRYAYCKLNIIYSWWMKLAVSVLYPIRNLIKWCGQKNQFIYNVYCVLKQEEIRRSFL